MTRNCRRCSFLFGIVYAMIVTSSHAELSSRIVRTKYGELSGVIVNLERYLESVEVFRGVPYASPPIGSLRFMPPVSGALWQGVKIADKFGPVCPQKLPVLSEKIPRGRLEYLRRLLPYLKNQSEDCLYLNIYAPVQAGARDSGGRRYPVIVFVHGESYEWSSGNPYDGSVLASYGGVVVVTINYRLGILGFLNANTDAHLRSPANYGLMDQIAALHWVQENIGYFGGDPGNVTLVGHGTGAACVNFLMTSHAVPDGLLFHRGILMSGSALSPWALIRGAAGYAMQVARHLNCSAVAGDPQALLRCLRDVPLNALLSTPVQGLAFAPAFGPSIDGVVIDPGDPDDQDFTLQVDTINTLNNILLRKDVVAKLSRYDLMVGVVKSEAYFYLTAENAQYGIEADRRTEILREFVRNTYTYHQPEILATIINEYTDWERPVQHPVNIRDETVEALGDANTVAPATRTADLHSQTHRNSYLYVFDYQTKFGDYPQRQGCIHGEELPYVFGAPLVGGLAHWPRNYTRAELALSESVILYFTNFARTGNPNEGTPEPGPSNSRPERTKLKNIEWTAYEAVHKKYLNIDIKSKLKNHYRAHRLSFWLNLVPDLHKPGSDDVPRSHHLLDAEQVPPRIIQRLPTTSRPTTQESTTEKSQNASTSMPSELAFEETTPQPEDGFAAYSTALSVTIAIGCSLLILNVLIFAGVYYKRDKNQHNCPKKRTQENGQMPNNICGELETKTERHHIQHIPPPEFADLQNNSCHVPMPPPPPKNTKPGKPAGPNLIISPNQLQQESMAMVGSGGTLKKGHNHQQIMEELRV
ncbi:neuroligin 3 [Neodiprion pinetum]|uniref:Neuroligin-4, Y-linked n=1 Tax=Neodiprion lecontei TaxID=441921 RepID=A0ABM3FPR4_NEOLC|nr:neuroligin-4, Y-linked [Neodiprion pinetum]XP_046472480.1 neuroligin-4, Y-linked [Neodiprion pinetum]XP_046590002.1 neuroligin-4, Y-linked [Neodiprion lecontei]XP_046610402.1 neuroligin-4, Y-linked [Neodiprion virginianus]XP_046610403.1 neuroligin-4, Y-linked [Neodiprion virginianus]